MTARRECKTKLATPVAILTNVYSTLHLDGFWSHGIGNEGAIRIEEEGA